ncbi:MAG TPA: efflux RND transporter periplasmic adaptor subunit [Nitrospiraceae bacterium]|nr:efflux RND transporter periplasmic adaptor subunit [Nitrospiraceae bacterium]
MAALVWISQGWNKATGLPGAADIASVSRIPVEVEAVRMGSVSDAVRAVGTLEANESVIVRPEIAGLVSRILFGEGQAVERGKVLIELDDTELRAHLAQAVAQLKIARLTSDRMTQLLGSNNSFVSQQQIDQAVSNLHTAEANHTVYQTRLAKTKVRAPFAGTVGMRRVSPGDYVQPGQDIVNLEDHATLKIDFKIPETYLNRLSVGQLVEIATDAYPGETFIGEVYAVDPRVDSVSRAVRVRAGIPNTAGQERVDLNAAQPRLRGYGARSGEPVKGPVSTGPGRAGEKIGKLRPGLFVNIKLELGRNDRAILVPEEAVIRQRDKTYVYRVQEETVRWTEVSLGVREQGHVQILNGLHEADTVVRVGHQKLNDGARVTRK